MQVDNNSISFTEIAECIKEALSLGLHKKSLKELTDEQKDNLEESKNV
jgi:hypothetical protein